MANTVSYVCTGYMKPNMILVNFTLGEESENLTYVFDGSRPIKEFLEEKAMYVMHALKNKALAKLAPKADLSSCVGVSGIIDVPDGPLQFPSVVPPSIFIDGSHSKAKTAEPSF